MIDLSRFKSKRGRAVAPATSELARVRGNWAPVTLEELTDRQHDGVYSDRTRLLLYLRIKSWRGQRAVRLTSEAAAAIGLSREQKRRCLHRLELDGYVAVARDGQRTPLVTVMPPKCDKTAH